MKSFHARRPVSLTLLALGACACIVAFGFLQIGGGSHVTASAAPQSTALAPAPGTPSVQGPIAKEPARHPKLTSPLAGLSDLAAQAKARGESFAPMAPAGLPDNLKGLTTAGLMQIDSDGQVQVYAEVDRVDFDVIDALAAAGLTIQRVASDSLIVQGMVPATDLDAVAGLQAVKHVRLPSYGFVQSGSVTTEGDAIIRADLVRQVFGVTGEGVKVGVVSAGVKGLAEAQQAGELPPDIDIQTCNAITHGNPPFIGGNPLTASAEGTAMLEIVHDIAPDAELWFGYAGDKAIYDGGTDEDFAWAVDCLASTAQVDVIVDDIAFYDSGPFDGTSLASTASSSALNDESSSIRVYSTSVGNSAVKHYQGQFENYGGSYPGWHKFQATSDTTDALNMGPSPFDRLWLEGGGAAVTVYLQWDDPWDASSNDYNLYLYREGGDGQPEGTPVASSEGVQDGDDHPLEKLTHHNNGEPGQFDIVIVKASGETGTLELFINWSLALPLPGTSSYHNFNTAASSVPGEGDAGGGVISVGAISASDQGHDTIEQYSSRGPTNDERVKPDITGIDQVRVSGAGGFGQVFGGTSAAAPHVAGVAALLLQCRPDLMAGEEGDDPSGDRTTVRDLILGNAVDLGEPGMDNTFGAGRLDAYASAFAAGGNCVAVDSDQDGVPDIIDNCPDDYNPDQLNTDGGPRNAGPQIPTGIASNPIEDSLGDVCDADDDNDNLPDGEESDVSCPYRLDFDSDGDNVPDGREETGSTCVFATTYCGLPSSDNDGDTISDCIERKYNTCTVNNDEEVEYSSCSDATDSDGDNCPDWLEMNDVNGDRSENVIDVMIVAKRYGGQIPPDQVSDAVLDVSHDGQINILDVQMVAQNQCSYRQQHGYEGPCPCAPE